MALNDQGRLHVFVSPHFDDGVLSCGGTIHQLAASGQQVLVMTMMGGAQQGDLPDSPILADLHQRWQAGDDPLKTRQHEDQLALCSLGADHLHISLTDCVYRQAGDLALYPSERSLFSEIHPGDFAADFLRAVEIPAHDQGITVYLPLAVGHHVDHQIVRNWGLELLDERSESRDFRFYAEYPYSNADQAIALALSKTKIPLRETRVLLDEADIQAKVKAIACYRSQISTFWQSLSDMEVDVRQSSRAPRGPGYVERFWAMDRQAPAL